MSDPHRTHFDTDHLTEELRGHVVRGSAATIGGQAIRLVLELTSAAVLARLLLIRDFGLFAMILPVIGFVSMAGSLGLSMATVQRETIDHQQVSTLFWFNAVLGIASMLFVIAIAPAVARFYDQPILTQLCSVLALGLVLNGLSVQHRALLRRQMRFRTLTAIELSALAAGIAVGILVAAMGYGVWALVWMQLVTNATLVVCAWVFCDWRPGRPVWNAETRSILGFVHGLTAHSLLNFLNRNLDYVLIGRWLGSAELGIYNRAYKLLLQPLRQIQQPVTGVAISALSRLTGDPDQYRRYYHTAVTFFAFVTTPVFVAMAVLGDEVVWIVLGEKWMEAGTGSILRVLAIAGMSQTISGSVMWIFISLGQTGRLLKWSLFSTPIIILAFWIGLRWGAFGVAVAYTIADIALSVPLYFYAYRFSPVSTGGLVRSIWRPYAVCVAAFIAMSVARAGLANAGPVVAVAATIAVGAAVCTAALMVWPALRAQFSNLRKIALLLFQRDAPVQVAG